MQKLWCVEFSTDNRNYKLKSFDKLLMFDFISQGSNAFVHELSEVEICQRI